MPDFFDSIHTNDLIFSTSGEFARAISADLVHKDSVQRYTIGHSEDGHPIHAFTAGRGDKHVALLGGAHSDEPVGPETLRYLIRNLINKENSAQDLLQKYTFIIIPHINPDGELKNRAWIKKWPDIDSYAAHAFREIPGRDLEFGYPNMRPENKAVAEFLQKHAPFDLYINFHGMAAAEGIMLLIEKHWIEQTQQLRQDFRALSEKHNLPLHDHNRGGEKGFQYIGPGFTTTPEGRAMQQHFKDKGDAETAAKFQLSSMEYIRSLGGNPLCLVTELPLYLVRFKDQSNNEPGVPKAYLKFKEQLPELRKHAASGESLEPLLNIFKIDPLPLKTAVEIQLSVLKKALELIEDKD